MEDLKKVEIHPISLKYLNQGHPFVTKDNFSKRFPANPFIYAEQNSRGKSDEYNKIFIMLREYGHPQIMARLFSVRPKIFFQQGHRNFKKIFMQEIQKKIEVALKKRLLLNLSRNNYYLIFAESDLIPGVFVQRLNQTLFIQYTSSFWKSFYQFFQKTLLEQAGQLFAEKFQIAYQWRLPDSDREVKRANNKSAKTFWVNENKVSLKIDLSLGQDIGVYTDMASIREKLVPTLKNKTRLLNLFSYTGAYSCWALANNQNILTTSVDLSSKYLEILEENLEKNQFTSRNKSIAEDATKFLKSTSEEYDYVIIDPPSTSSNYKNKSSALDFYKKNLGKIVSLLQTDGYLLIFLNTHKIKTEKFKNQIIQELKKNNIEQKLKFIQSYRLDKDCPPLPQLKESNYLKGLLFKKL